MAPRWVGAFLLSMAGAAASPSFGTSFSTPQECPVPSYQCLDGETCLEEGRVCDGTLDCPVTESGLGGEEEEGCASRCLEEECTHLVRENRRLQRELAAQGQGIANLALEVETSKAELEGKVEEVKEICVGKVEEVGRKLNGKMEKKEDNLKKEMECLTNVMAEEMRMLQEAMAEKVEEVKVALAGKMDTTTSTTTTTTSTSTTTTTTTPPPPDPCTSYRELSSFTRHKTTYRGAEGVKAACGTAGKGRCCDTGYHSHPDWAGPGWYRFTGLAGTKMPDSPPAQFYCTGDAQGWLSGGHPGPGEQVNRSVNFSRGSNTTYRSVEVLVTNCPSAYYVYRLPEAPFCHLTYCGE